MCSGRGTYHFRWNNNFAFSDGSINRAFFGIFVFVSLHKYVLFIFYVGVRGREYSKVKTMHKMCMKLELWSFFGLFIYYSANSNIYPVFAIVRCPLPLCDYWLVGKLVWKTGHKSNKHKNHEVVWLSLVALFAILLCFCRPTTSINYLDCNLIKTKTNNSLAQKYIFDKLSCFTDFIGVHHSLRTPIYVNVLGHDFFFLHRT